MIDPDGPTRQLDEPPPQGRPPPPAPPIAIGACAPGQGSSPSISRETRELLRDRVRVAARVVAGGLSLFLIRDLLLPTGAYLPWVRLVLIVGFAAAGLRLRTTRPLGLTGLRRLEVAMLWSLSLWFAVGGARLIQALRQQVWEARELGQYRLTDKIGEGGMGQVWRAEHRLLPRPAAIKLIRPELFHTSSALHHDDALQRFEREVRATANLRSPHTVEIYDFGITEDNVFYYVMELLDGMDLQSLVRAHGPLPDGRVAFLLAQVTESLDEAHEQGLVHRDVKPANIYACQLGNCFDFVKVLDFGLVAVTDPEMMQTVHAHGVAGTPAFMAPETLRQDTFVDCRADLYALGCVGYWLLAGRPVFEATTTAEIARAHLETPPTPLAAHAGRTIDPGLEAAITACLHKEPGDRPASAAELGAMLHSSPAFAAWNNDLARAWWQGDPGTLSAASLPRQPPL